MQRSEVMQLATLVKGRKSISGALNINSLDIQDHPSSANGGDGYNKEHYSKIRSFSVPI